jgi:hypothetical protein
LPASALISSQQIRSSSFFGVMLLEKVQNRMMVGCFFQSDFFAIAACALQFLYENKIVVTNA